MAKQTPVPPIGQPDSDLITKINERVAAKMGQAIADPMTAFREKAQAAIAANPRLATKTKQLQALPDRDPLLDTVLQSTALTPENFEAFKSEEPLTTYGWQKTARVTDADGMVLDVPYETGFVRNFDPATGKIVPVSQRNIIPKDATHVQKEEIPRVQFMRSRQLREQSMQNVQDAVKGTEDTSWWNDLGKALQTASEAFAAPQTDIRRGTPMSTGIDELEKTVKASEARSKAYFDPKSRDEEMFGTIMDGAFMLASLFTGGIGGAVQTVAKETGKRTAWGAIKRLASKEGFRAMVGDVPKGIASAVQWNGLFREASRNVIKPALGMSAVTGDEADAIENTLGLDLSNLDPDERMEYLNSLKQLSAKAAYSDALRAKLDASDTASGLLSNAADGALSAVMASTDGQMSEATHLDTIKRLTDKAFLSDENREAIFGVLNDYGVSAERGAAKNLTETIARGTGSALTDYFRFARPMQVMGGEGLGIYDTFKNATRSTERAVAALAEAGLTRGGAWAGLVARGLVTAPLRATLLGVANAQPGNVKDASYKYRKLLDRGLSPAKAALASYGAEMASLFIENLSEQEYLPLMEPIIDAAEKSVKGITGRFVRGFLETGLGEGFEETTGRYANYAFENIADVPRDMRQQADMPYANPKGWEEAAQDYLISGAMGAVLHLGRGVMNGVFHPVKTSVRIAHGFGMMLDKEGYLNRVTDSYAKKYGFESSAEGREAFRTVVERNEGTRLDKIAQMVGPVDPSQTTGDSPVLNQEPPVPVNYTGPVVVQTAEGEQSGRMTGYAGRDPDTGQHLASIEGLAQPVPMTNLSIPLPDPEIGPDQLHRALADEMTAVMPEGEKKTAVPPQGADVAATESEGMPHPDDLRTFSKVEDELFANMPVQPSWDADIPDVQEAPRPAVETSVPVMMTGKMETQLRDLGHTQDAIDKMTPAEAWDILKTPVVQDAPVAQDERTTAEGTSTPPAETNAATGQETSDTEGAPSEAEPSTPVRSATEAAQPTHIDEKGRAYFVGPKGGVYWRTADGARRSTKTVPAGVTPASEGLTEAPATSEAPLAEPATDPATDPIDEEQPVPIVNRRVRQSIIDRGKQAQADFEARMKNREFRSMIAPFTPQDIRDLVLTGAMHVAEGLNTLEDWAKQMSVWYGKAWNDIEAHVLEQIRTYKHEVDPEAIRTAPAPVDEVEIERAPAHDQPSPTARETLSEGETIQTNRDIRGNLAIKLNTLHLTDPDTPPVEVKLGTDDLRAMMRSLPFHDAVSQISAQVLTDNPDVAAQDHAKVRDAVHAFVYAGRQRLETAVATVAVTPDGVKISVGSTYDIPPFASSVTPFLKFAEQFGFQRLQTGATTELESPFFAFRTVVYEGARMTIPELLKTEGGEGVFTKIEEAMAAQGLFLLGVPGANPTFIGVALDPASVAQSASALEAFHQAALAFDGRTQTGDAMESYTEQSTVPDNPRTMLNSLRASFYLFHTGSAWAQDPQRAWKYMNNHAASDLTADKEVFVASLNAQQIKARKLSGTAQAVTSELLNPDGTWNIIEPSPDWNHPKDKDTMPPVDRLKADGWDLLAGGIAIKQDKDGKVTDAALTLTMVEDADGMTTDGASFYTPAVSWLMDRATGHPQGRVKLGKWRIAKPFSAASSSHLREIIWKGQFQPAQQEMRRTMLAQGIGMIVPKSTVKIGDYAFQKYETVADEVDGRSATAIYLLPPSFIAKANDATSKARSVVALGTQAFFACTMNRTLSGDTVYDAVGTLLSRSSRRAGELTRQLHGDPDFRAAMFNSLTDDWVDEGEARTGEAGRRGVARLLRRAKKQGFKLFSYLPHVAFGFGNSPLSTIISGTVDPKDGAMRGVGAAAYLCADAGSWDWHLPHALLESNPDLTHADLPRYFDMTQVDDAELKSIIAQRQTTYDREKRLALQRMTKENNDKPAAERKLESLVDLDASRAARTAVLRRAGVTSLQTKEDGDVYYRGTGRLRSRIEGVEGTPVIVSRKKAREMNWTPGTRIMGVVIPTDAPHSMQACTVIGTTQMDDAVFWPSEITAKLGKDHDGDKIYLWGESRGYWARQAQNAARNRQNWMNRRQEAEAEGRAFDEPDPGTPDEQKVWETYDRFGYMETDADTFDPIWTHYNSPEVRNYVSKIYEQLGAKDAFDPKADNFLMSLGRQFPVVTRRAGTINRVNPSTPEGSAQIASWYVGATADAIGQVASMRKKFEMLVQQGVYTPEQMKRIIMVDGHEMRVIDAIYLANAILTNHAVDAPKKTNFFQYDFDPSRYLLAVDALLRNTSKEDQTPLALKARGRELRRMLRPLEVMAAIKAGSVSAVSSIAGVLEDIDPSFGGRIGTLAKQNLLQYMARYAHSGALMERVSDGFHDVVPASMSPEYYRMFVEFDLMNPDGQSGTSTRFMREALSAQYVGLVTSKTGSRIVDRRYFINRLADDYSDWQTKKPEHTRFMAAFLPVQTASKLMGMLDRGTTNDDGTVRGGNITGKRKVWQGAALDAHFAQLEHGRRSGVPAGELPNPALPVAQLMRTKLETLLPTLNEPIQIGSVLATPEGVFLTSQDGTKQSPLTEGRLAYLMNQPDVSMPNQARMDFFDVFTQAAVRTASPFIVTAKEFEDIADQSVPAYLADPRTPDILRRGMQVMLLSSSRWRLTPKIGTRGTVDCWLNDVDMGAHALTPGTFAKNRKGGVQGSMVGSENLNRNVAQAILESEAARNLNMLGFRYLTPEMQDAYLRGIEDSYHAKRFMSGVMLPEPRPLIDETTDLAAGEVLGQIQELTGLVDTFGSWITRLVGATRQSLADTGQPPAMELAESLTVPEMEMVRQYTSSITERAQQMIRKLERLAELGIVSLNEGDKAMLKTLNEHLFSLGAFGHIVRAGLQALRVTLMGIKGVLHGLDRLVGSTTRAGIHLRELGALVNGVVSEEPIYLDHVLGFTEDGEMWFHDDAVPDENGIPGKTATRLENRPHDMLYEPHVSGLFYRQVTNADGTVSWKKIWMPQDGGLMHIMANSRQGMQTGAYRTRLIDAITNLVQQRSKALTSLKRIMAQGVEGLPYNAVDQGQPAFLQVLQEGETWVPASEENLKAGDPFDERVAFERLLLSQLHHPDFIGDAAYVLAPVTEGGTPEWHWTGSINEPAVQSITGSKAKTDLFVDSYKALREYLQRQNHAVFQSRLNTYFWRRQHMQSDLYSAEERQAMVRRMNETMATMQRLEAGDPYFPLMLQGALEDPISNARVWALAFADSYYLTDAISKNYAASQISPELALAIKLEGAARQLTAMDRDRSESLGRIVMGDDAARKALAHLVDLWGDLENTRSNAQRGPIVTKVEQARRDLAMLLEGGAAKNVEAAMLREIATLMQKEDRAVALPGGADGTFDVYMQKRLINPKAMFAPSAAKVAHTRIAGPERFDRYLHTDIPRMVAHTMDTHLQGIFDGDVAAITDTFIRRLRGASIPQASTDRAVNQWERWVKGNFKHNSYSQIRDWSSLAPGDGLEMQFTVRVPSELDPSTTVEQHHRMGVVYQGRNRTNEHIFTVQDGSRWSTIRVNSQSLIASKIGRFHDVQIEHVASAVQDDWFEMLHARARRRSGRSQVISGATPLNPVVLESSPVIGRIARLAKAANIFSGASKLGVNFASSLRNGLYAVMNQWISTGYAADMQHYRHFEMILKNLDKGHGVRNEAQMSLALQLADIMDAMDFKNFDYLSGATQMAGADKSIARASLFTKAGRTRLKRDVLTPMKEYHLAMLDVNHDIERAGLPLDDFMSYAATRQQKLFDRFSERMAKKGHPLFQQYKANTEVREKVNSGAMNTMYAFFAYTERCNRQMTTAMALAHTGQFLSQKYVFEAGGKKVQTTFRNLPEGVQSDLLRSYALQAGRNDERVNYDYSNIMRKPVLRQPIMQMFMKFSTFAMANAMWRVRETRESASILLHGTKQTTTVTDKATGKTETKAAGLARNVDWTAPVNPLWFQGEHARDQWKQMLRIAFEGGQTPEREEQLVNDLRASLEAQHGITLQNFQFNPLARSLRYLIAMATKRAVETSMLVTIAGLSEPFSEFIMGIYDMVLNFSGLADPPDDDELRRAVAYELSGIREDAKLEQWRMEHAEEVEKAVRRRLEADPQWRRASSAYSRDLVRSTLMSVPWGGGMVASKAWSAIGDAMIANPDRYPRSRGFDVAKDLVSIPIVKQAASVFSGAYLAFAGSDALAWDTIAKGMTSFTGNVGTPAYSERDMGKAAVDVAKASRETVGKIKAKHAGDREGSYDLVKRTAEAHVKVAELGEGFFPNRFMKTTQMQTAMRKEAEALERVRIDPSSDAAVAHYKTLIESYWKKPDPSDMPFLETLPDDLKAEMDEIRQNDTSLSKRKVERLAARMAEARQPDHNARMEKAGIEPLLIGKEVDDERNANLRKIKPKKSRK